MNSFKCKLEMKSMFAISLILFETIFINCLKRVFFHALWGWGVFSYIAIDDIERIVKTWKWKKRKTHKSISSINNSVLSLLLWLYLCWLAIFSPRSYAPRTRICWWNIHFSIYFCSFHSSHIGKKVNEWMK